MSAWAKGFAAKRLQILVNTIHPFWVAMRRFAGRSSDRLLF